MQCWQANSEPSIKRTRSCQKIKILEGFTHPRAAQVAGSRGRTWSAVEEGAAEEAAAESSPEERRRPPLRMRLRRPRRFPGRGGCLRLLLPGGRRLRGWGRRRARPGSSSASCPSSAGSGTTPGNGGSGDELVTFRHFYLRRKHSVGSTDGKKTVKGERGHWI